MSRAKVTALDGGLAVEDESAIIDAFFEAENNGRFIIRGASPGDKLNESTTIVIESAGVIDKTQFTTYELDVTKRGRRFEVLDSGTQNNLAVSAGVGAQTFSSLGGFVSALFDGAVQLDAAIPETAEVLIVDQISKEAYLGEEGSGNNPSDYAITEVMTIERDLSSGAFFE